MITLFRCGIKLIYEVICVMNGILQRIKNNWAVLHFVHSKLLAVKCKCLLFAFPGKYPTKKVCYLGIIIFKSRDRRQVLLEFACFSNKNPAFRRRFCFYMTLSVDGSLCLYNFLVYSYIIKTPTQIPIGEWNEFNKKDQIFHIQIKWFRRSYENFVNLSSVSS